MGRRKATECKVCGSKELYIGAYCHECHKKHRLTVPNYKSWLNKVNEQADIKRKAFIETYDFGDLEYVEGFTSGNCEITLKCKTCGAYRKITIDGARSSVNNHNAALRCIVCHPNKGHMKWDEWLTVQRSIGEKQRAETKARKEEEARIRIRTVECVVCGKTFQTIQPNQKTCSKECGKKRQNHRSDHRISKDAIVDRDITLATLYQRDEGICYICGCTCDWNDIDQKDEYVITGKKYPSIDHIIPISRGGKHEWSNVRLACRECNCKKSDISPVEFLGTEDYTPENAEILKRTPRKTRKTVVQRTKTGDIIGVYESAAEAARKTGFKERQIQNNARGETKSYRGFVWEYV